MGTSMKITISSCMIVKHIIDKTMKLIQPPIFLLLPSKSIISVFSFFFYSSYLFFDVPPKELFEPDNVMCILLASICFELLYENYGWLPPRL